MSLRVEMGNPGCKTLRLKPEKRLVRLMLLWVVLTLVGVAPTACGGHKPAPMLMPTAPETAILPDENLEAAIRDALGKAPGGR